MRSKHFHRGTAGQSSGWAPGQPCRLRWAGTGPRFPGGASPSPTNLTWVSAMLCRGGPWPSRGSDIALRSMNAAAFIPLVGAIHESPAGDRKDRHCIHAVMREKRSGESTLPHLPFPGRLHSRPANGAAAESPVRLHPPPAAADRLHTLPHFPFPGRLRSRPANGAAAESPACLLPPPAAADRASYILK